MSSLKQFVLTEYYSNEYKEFLSQLPDDTPLNYLQFIQRLSDYLEQQEEDINVAKSTTWGLCQEYLGHTLDVHDREQLSCRGGIWAINTQTCSVTSTRQVFDTLKNLYR